MISTNDQALLRLQAQRSGLSIGNVKAAWEQLLTHEERDALLAQAREDLRG